MGRANDVVVIGGGIVGAGVAYYLAKRGVGVTLVDRGDLLSGASRAGIGGISLATKTIGAKLDLARLSVELYQGLSDELSEDIEFRVEGGMIAAESESEAEVMRKRCDEYRAAGVDTRWVDAQEVHELQPAFAPHVLGAQYTADDAHVNPMALTLAFARKARQLGATIQTFSPVKGIRVQGGKVYGVCGTDWEIATHTVVNAAGPWARHVAQMVGLDLPVVPRKGEVLITEPAPHIITGVICNATYLLSKKPPAGAPSTAMVAGVVAAQAARGTLVLGSTRQYVGFDRTSSVEAAYELARQTVRLVPAIGKLHMIRQYAGLRPAAPDGLPILEKSERVQGYVIAAGHEGDGIALAPATGHVITQLITGEMPPEGLAAFSSQRFQS